LQITIKYLSLFCIMWHNY